METLSIIYEDENILVVNKPSGLVVHPFDFSSEGTLLDLIQKHTPSTFENIKTLQDGRSINLGGIVHKLDRETSGVLVYAKNKKTYDELSSLFKNHDVEKVYQAYVEGTIEKDFFTINAPLGREKKSYKQSVNPDKFRGELREAITDVKVIDRHENSTLVELYPKTGRTHQLRAHMAHIGHPILGDSVYGEKESAKRLMLHAQSIILILNNKKETFTAETPEDFVCPH